MSVPSEKKKDFRIDILGVVVSRVAMFSVLFWVTLRFDSDSLQRVLVLTYGVSTVLYLAQWAWAYRLSRASPVGFLLYFQFFVEILVEAAIFFLIGGYTSDYGLLFIPTILSSGFFFQFLGSIPMATLATCLFGYAGLMHLGLIPMSGLGLPDLTLETIQVRFFLYTSLFYMVALLSAHLSKRLKTANQELEGTHEALDLYQFSVENMMKDLPNGLIFFNPEGTLTYSNHLAQELLSKEDPAGMSMEEAFGKFRIPSELCGDILAQKADFPYTEIEISEFPDKPLHIQVKPLIREGKYLGCILIVIDFTNEKLMERALLRAERMAALGEMSARIAHEIRNPLASISGSAQMLQVTQVADQTDRRLLNLIVTESTRLDRTLTSLLEYARDRTPSYRPVSVQSLFKKVRSVLEKNPSFNKDLVIIRQFIQNEEIHFLSDKDILFQILLNVSLNSLQSLVSGRGFLEFSGKSSNEQVLLEIRDNGCGMTQSELSRAFEPFFTTKSNGTGLGLATCLHYVQSLEGTINLTSVIGEGTTVSINLPKRIL